MNRFGGDGLAARSVRSDQARQTNWRPGVDPIERADAAVLRPLVDPDLPTRWLRHPASESPAATRAGRGSVHGHIIDQLHLERRVLERTANRDPVQGL